ncbi:DEAD-box ATP-dependent RNA helicase 32 [Nicotiana tomentosiformis]|uniref:DEAD-box ATP-dependent RNA helicase 32 n=1 Tax=Nicotiana tomentosiformis TaxID=4098 RepID=UPI00051C056C|nr:DEAD-box ATP-dependent RNA helicase 32 [Nicotiana tomentosiformis]
MRKHTPKSRKAKIQSRLSEVHEIELLEAWIESGKPESGSNPLSLEPLPHKAPVGCLPDGSFSRYAGCDRFSQLPVSKKTKDGLIDCKFKTMTDIQRASLPHSLCGRDILGAAKTGSGKTLAFVIPVLEKLYKARWGDEDGVGCIIMSPTRELAGQLFDVLKSVGKHHGFSAGLLIGGRKDVDTEKEHVNSLNILVCTPGRLLQHMDETPNFDCSQLQVLVLDEADRILDVGFKRELNAIISQLPKHRQTLLFSATQTKSVQDLARLSLKDPEYLGVHEESDTATPNRLQQTAMLVPLDKKLDMLWSFIKAHLNSRILVFLSSCKQVKFVFEAFKKLRPGIPLKCLHGRMKQDRRMGIYSQFCEQRSVLFSTDVASRGLDFNKAVDWVVQVDCPEDCAAYIHRVGRTARYLSGGRSLLFVMPSEMKMLEKLEEKKIPLRVIKANEKRIQSVSDLLASLLVKYPDLQHLSQRAFVTYLKSIHKQREKEIFDVTKLPIDEFSASLGLPMTPKIRFLKQKLKGKTVSEALSLLPDDTSNDNLLELPIKKPDTGKSEGEEVEEDLLLAKETQEVGELKINSKGDDMPATRVLKKKKLKINVHRPVGTRVVFDEEGNTLPPLARLADTSGGADSVQLNKEKVNERYAELRKNLKLVDKEDKDLDRKRLKEKRIKEKMKYKRGREEEEDEELSGSDGELSGGRVNKKTKIFDSDDDDGEKPKDMAKEGIAADAISVAEQEELALKLLSSMNS